MSKSKNTSPKVSTASKAIDRKENIAQIMQVMPIILIAAFVPILVQFTIAIVPDNIQGFWISDGIHMDFFSKIKATYLMIFSCLSVLVLIGLKLTKLGATPGIISFENRTLVQKLFYKQNVLQMERVILVPLAIYTVLTVLSALFSEYKEVAFAGFPDRYEGLWVLVAYVAIWGTIIALVKDIKQVHFIVGAMVFSGIIICIIGIGQYFGNDLFASELGKNLIIPENYSRMREGLQFNVAPNTAYSTLFNPNNVGSMMSMLGVFGMTVALLAKCIYVKIIAAVFAAMNIFTLLASNSRGGYLGAFAGIVFLAVMLLLVYKLNPKYIAISVVVILVPIVIAVSMEDKFRNLANLSLDALIGVPVKPVSEMQTAEVATQILGFTTGSDTVEIMTDAGNLYVTYKGKEDIEIRDEDNNLIDYTIENKAVKNTSQKFSNLGMVIGENDITMTLGRKAMFAFHENEVWFVGVNGRLVKAVDETPVYPKFLATYGKMGSMRGIIWGKTIPLLKDTLLIGKGPDTFAMYYPQNDYTSKITYFATTNIIVDKAHNLYVQIALNQGVLALIGFIGALGMYYFWSIKNLLKRRDVSNIYITYNVAFSSGMAAYLVAGMFNDSIVSVAPIFWIMWGLGSAINCMITRTPIAE